MAGRNFVQRRKSRARGCFEAQVSTERLERRLLLFVQFNSWESTATDGAGLNQGDAATLTWSIVRRDSGWSDGSVSGNLQSAILWHFERRLRNSDR